MPYEWTVQRTLERPEIHLKSSKHGKWDFKNLSIFICTCVLSFFDRFFLNFVVMGWSLLPNELRSFQDLCVPLNLDMTRTWICRLNFAQRPTFQAWGSLTSLKSQTRDPPEDLCSGFSRPEKIHRPQPDLNPANLGSRGEHVTPRPPRQTSKIVTKD